MGDSAGVQSPDTDSSAPSPRFTLDDLLRNEPAGVECEDWWPARGTPQHALSWLPVGCDVYTPTRIWEWWYVAHNVEQLELRKVRPVQVLGSMKDVLWGGAESVHEIVLPDEIFTCGPDNLGRFDNTALQWALEEGVVPGQRFCLCIDEPTVHEHHDYWTGEYDCDFSWTWEIVQREPVANVAVRWERAFNKIKNARARTIREVAAFEHLRETDTAAWALDVSSRWHAYEARLVTTHVRPGSPFFISSALLEGRAQTESGALSFLVEAACKKWLDKPPLLEALHRLLEEHRLSKDTVQRLRGGIQIEECV